MDKVSFSEPLKHLSVIGLNPFQKDFCSLTKQIIFMVMFTVSVTSTYLELFSNYDNFDTLVRASACVVPQIQMFIKFVALIIYKSDIKNLLNMVKYFWDLGEFGEEHQINLAWYHQLLRYFYSSYKITLVVTAIIMYILSIIEGKFLVLTYGENELGTKMQIMYWIMHSLLLVALCFLVLGFDSLFLYFIAHAVTEFKMIKTAFSCPRILTLNGYENTFNVIVKHHSRVLDFIRQTDNVFSNILLGNYMCSLFGICFGLFLLTSEGIPPQFKYLLKFLPYLITFTFQIWMYSFAGNLVVDWSLDISDEMFYDDWEEDQAYKNKQMKLIIIARSQTGAHLTLGGFGNLDLKSFKEAIHQAFSFFTFINALKET